MPRSLRHHPIVALNVVAHASGFEVADRPPAPGTQGKMKPRSMSGNRAGVSCRGWRCRTSGVRRLAPFGRCALAFFMHGEAFGEPARHAADGWPRGCRRDSFHATEWLPQLKSPGLRAAEGESMATTSPKVTPSAPEAGHAHRADGEVFVVGIDFKLHRPRAGSSCISSEYVASAWYEARRWK